MADRYAIECESFIELFKSTISELGNVNTPLSGILGIKWGDTFKTTAARIAGLDMQPYIRKGNTYRFTDSQSQVVEFTSARTV